MAARSFMSMTTRSVNSERLNWLRVTYWWHSHIHPVYRIKMTLKFLTASLGYTAHLFCRIAARNQIPRGPAKESNRESNGTFCRHQPAVSVDSKGRIFVVDTKACSVCYFKPTGRYLGQFGSRGTNDNQFTGPVGIAVDSTDRIYVTDTPVHCIKVFENGGEFLFRFGSNGPEWGCFHSPTYLCFDSNDLLYVSDSGNCRIQVFDNHGQFLRLLTTPLGMLNDPNGIAVSLADQMAVVVDSGNFCIKAFQMYDPVASETNNKKLERQKPSM
ncbi:unnamed protein product [Dibothriocephalus latus]|uniref:SMP-30/Gluconolactonase/LRE-like region domain-containing protein n=1 Tax=Dibothriocephalus latus TaxID=60516 RepID=A0A3P6TSD8_DIBLA|nr:unnamed protein product [Dibothriocephalus latus]